MDIIEAEILEKIINKAEIPNKKIRPKHFFANKLNKLQKISGSLKFPGISYSVIFDEDLLIYLSKRFFMYIQRMLITYLTILMRLLAILLIIVLVIFIAKRLRKYHLKKLASNNLKKPAKNFLKINFKKIMFISAFFLLTWLLLFMPLLNANNVTNQEDPLLVDTKPLYYLPDVNNRPNNLRSIQMEESEKLLDLRVQKALKHTENREHLTEFLDQGGTIKEYLDQNNKIYNEQVCVNRKLANFRQTANYYHSVSQDKNIDPALGITVDVRNYMKEVSKNMHKELITIENDCATFKQKLEKNFGIKSLEGSDYMFSTDKESLFGVRIPDDSIIKSNVQAKNIAETSSKRLVNNNKEVKSGKRHLIHTISSEFTDDPTPTINDKSNLDDSLYGSKSTEAIRVKNDK